ncbi:MAG: 3'-5' exonuclease [bacterium]|nr:3'-5' exonuclease [bacterium]
MNNDIKKFPIKDFDFSFVDTETTGPDLRHELTEIGLIKVSSYNFSVLEEWETKIKPKHIELADPEALKINHYKEEDWRDALELETAMKIFLEKTANTILVGHNLLFDWFHINKALEECDLEPTFHYKGLDTFSLGWQKLRHLPNFPKLSLSEMAKHFDIKQEKPHSALDDTRTTYKVFLKLMEYK